MVYFSIIMVVYFSIIIYMFKGSFFFIPLQQDYERKENKQGLLNLSESRENRKDIDISTLRTDDRDDGHVGKKYLGIILFFKINI